MSKSVNILSLFGWHEIGAEAIKYLGWNVERYFSSEIDEYAMKIASNNHPDLIHIWSVEDVRYYDRQLHTRPMTVTDDGVVTDASHVVDIDLIIGGPPCTDLSSAKKWGKGLAWEKSSLFYEFARVLREVKPKYFLMENVASMKESEKEKITKTLRDIYPDTICHLFDSKLTSAQNRRRLWWSNFPIQAPEDQGITIKDILEDIPMDDPRWKPIPEKYLTPDGIVRIKEATIKWYVDCGPGDIVDIAHEWSSTHRGRKMKDKLHTLTANMHKGNIPYVIGVARDRKDERLRIPEDQKKLPTLRAVMGTGGNNVPLLIRPDLYWRPLTVTEVERAFNLRDGYTHGVSKTRALKMLGNGWDLVMVQNHLSYCPLFPITF